MGTYLNPGNSGFERICKGDYTDKTGMISLLNNRIGGPENLVCISRPRRFGKTYAAQMLCAYYGRTCRSDDLFNGRLIAEDPSYRQHLNKYDVIYVDMAGIKPYTEKYHSLVPFLIETLTDEILQQYPEVIPGRDFPTTLRRAVEAEGCANEGFIMIIDEWDAPIREGDIQIQKDYLDFLRSLFKNSGVTSQVFAAAYMTGILPIKKDGSHSAISEFKEFTMLRPGPFAEYIGFTETEVQQLCRKYVVDFQSMKQWYDGYSFQRVDSVYNPNSVMQAIAFNAFDSYWVESSSAEPLMDYISKDYHGLTQTVAELIGGIDVEINPVGFANDLTTFRGKDDVLVLLVHLGYLTYDAGQKKVHIPNEEVRMEFQQAIHNVDHKETMHRLQESEQLLADTLEGNEQAVAKCFAKIHREETTPVHYNNEQSLRSVIKLAYYIYRDYYLQLEELPAGEGYADVMYLPKPGSSCPALVIELKWNVSAQSAIDQIHTRDYPAALAGYVGEIMLVGVNYDKKSKEHSCRIERMTLE